MIVKAGNPINLNLQIDDGSTDKYVRAYLKDSNGDDLPESPVDLQHVGNGLYSDDSVTMPGYDEVTATYKVFSDSGYTTLDTEYTHGFDVFQKHIAGFENEQQIVTGEISSDEIFGEVSSDDSLSGDMEGCA